MTLKYRLKTGLRVLSKSMLDDKNLAILLYLLITPSVLIGVSFVMASEWKLHTTGDFIVRWSPDTFMHK